MCPANRQKDNSLALSAEVLVMPDDLPNARADGKSDAFVLAPPAQDTRVGDADAVHARRRRCAHHPRELVTAEAPFELVQHGQEALGNGRRRRVWHDSLRRRASPLEVRRQDAPDVGDLEPERVLVLLHRLRRIQVRARPPPPLNPQATEHVPVDEVDDGRAEVPTVREEEMAYPRRRHDSNADAMKSGVLCEALEPWRYMTDDIQFWQIQVRKYEQDHFRGE